MITFEPEYAKARHADSPIARVKVLGIGGAGGNKVNSMIEAQFEHVDFIAANTDAQALKQSKAPFKIQLGSKSTKGLGAGANPEVGRRAAEEDIEQVIEHVAGADIVFLVGGMGGGTASGATPVIARALKDRGILTIAVVTRPFLFEGKRRMAIAEHAIEALRKEVDTLIVIPNEKLLELADQQVSLLNAFDMINQVINQFVRGVTDIIVRPGHINVDFADLKAIMHNMGLAVIGTGRASGMDRAEQAALNAISSPLLENINIKGAKSILLNIAGDEKLGLHEVSAAACVIYKQAHEEANIILGSVIDPSLKDEVMVTVIATGFIAEQPIQQAPQMRTVMQQEQQKTAVQSVLSKEQPMPAAKVEPMVQQAAPQQMPQPAVKVEEDLNNLEIPALLRRIAREQLKP